MLNLLPIKLKALFILTVFAANFCAVCHCRHIAIMDVSYGASEQGKMHGEKADCCDRHCTGTNCAAAQTPSNGKGGCSRTQAIKFSLLEKQTAQQINLHPLSSIALTHNFIYFIDSPLSSIKKGDKILNEWLNKQSPPNFQALYQRFLI